MWDDFLCSEQSLGLESFIGSDNVDSLYNTFVEVSNWLLKKGRRRHCTSQIVLFCTNAQKDNPLLPVLMPDQCMHMTPSNRLK
mmetsp:Transcript_8958/g.13552  ORF Transcript_8958/g.13552 Transcript_8958/m.13552 type:complete len:83 (-) Transcript_8958:579-827(-)